MSDKSFTELLTNLLKARGVEKICYASYYTGLGGGGGG